MVIVGIVVVLAMISASNKKMKSLRFEVMGSLNATSRFPSPKELDDEEIAMQIMSLGNFASLYQKLPAADQAGLKVESDKRQQYWMELMLEMQSRNDKTEGESMAPIIQKTYELMRQGIPEAEAKKRAIEEYMSDREARQSAN